MKLLRYGPSGHEAPGLLDADGAIRDLSGIVGDIGRETLLPGSLERLRAIDPATLPKVAGTPRIGPCVGQVGKFICIGLNYSDHAAESGMAVPKEPIVFMKATSAIVGPNDDVVLPRGSQKTDWEVELGVVIGQPAKYVAGGGCAVARRRLLRRQRSLRARVSARGHGAVGERQERRHVRSDRPVARHRATRSPIAAALDLWLEVDGHRYQNGSTQHAGLRRPVSGELPEPAS